MSDAQRLQPRHCRVDVVQVTVRDGVASPLFGASAAVTLALELVPEQLRHLERRYRRNNADYRKDWIALSPAELRDKRLAQLVERSEMVYGRLDDAHGDAHAADRHGDQRCGGQSGAGGGQCRAPSST